MCQAHANCKSMLAKCTEICSLLIRWRQRRCCGLCKSLPILHCPQIILLILSSSFDTIILRPKKINCLIVHFRLTLKSLPTEKGFFFFFFFFSLTKSWNHRFCHKFGLISSENVKMFVKIIPYYTQIFVSPYPGAILGAIELITSFRTAVYCDVECTVCVVFSISI